MASTDASCSAPYDPNSSRGSSVSSRLQDEYNELLKYAVVVPSYDPEDLPKSLTDFRGSFHHKQRKAPPSSQDLSSSHEDQESTVNGDEGEADEETETESLQSREDERYKNTAPYMYSTSAKETQNPQFMKTQGEKHLTDLMQRPTSPTPSNGSSHTSSLAYNLNHNADKFLEEEKYTATIDQDMGRMEGLMDEWTYDLKRNVLAEFSRAKIQMMEQYRQQLQKERERHGIEASRSQTEMEGLRELLHTYEMSIERKDQVISNLTRAMQQQRDRFEMMRTFCEWKIRHNDLKREAFASNLARKHYERALSQKIWDAWHSVVEVKWKQRVEMACQSKAQEVCMQLTNDYEAKIASLNEALEASRVEVNRLHAERDRYEETMKKAFMRGVCALNMEAMSMFHEADEDQNNGHDHQGAPPVSSYPHVSLDHATASIAQEPIYSTEPPGAPTPRIITSQNASRVPLSQTAPLNTMAKGTAGTKSRAPVKGKTISAKVTARTDTGRSIQTLGGSQMSQTLAPPMSSVIVERHQPVNKETMGHARASMYIQASQGADGKQGGIIHRKVAGQAGHIPLAAPNIRTVKVD